MIYFRKDYKLLIHSITYEQQLRSTVYSQYFGNSTNLLSIPFKIQINNVIDISTVDIVNGQQEKSDFQVTLDISNFANGVKNTISQVKFEINKQKILASSSVNFYTRNLLNRCGTIQYKFISCKSIQITQEQAKKNKFKRDQVIKADEFLSQNAELRGLKNIVNEKNGLIKNLEKKISQVMQERRRLGYQLSRQKSQQKKHLKGLNFNQNFASKADNILIAKRVKLLQTENHSLQMKINNLTKDLEELQFKAQQTLIQNQTFRIQLGRRSIAERHFSNIQHEQQKYQDNLLLRKSKLADSLYQSQFVPQQNAENPVANVANKIKKQKQSILILKKTNLQKSMMKQTYVNLIGIQQVNDQVKKLKQYIDLKDLNDPHRIIKLQAALKNSFRIIQRICDQKQMLQNKIKNKQEQINYANRQLQKIKLNYRNIQKQIRQRNLSSRQNYDTNVSQIKRQAERQMIQLRKKNQYAQTEQVYLWQKRTLQLQKKVFDYNNLKDRNNQLQIKIKQLITDKQQQQNKFSNIKKDLTQEKQLYKNKYYEMQNQLNKQQQEVILCKQKAQKYEFHLNKIEQLQKSNETIKKKLENQQKLKNDFQKKCKHFQDKFKQFQPKYLNSQQIQNEFYILKKRCQNLNSSNQRFEARYKQLRSYVSKIQSAYYQKKNRKNFQEFDQQHQKLIQQRLQKMFKKLKNYQKQYYEQQINQQKQHIRELIEYYNRKCQQQKQKINENRNLIQVEKTRLKLDKQQEITQLKKQKIGQIQQKIKGYSTQYAKLINSQDYLPQGLNEKISYLQQKLRKFQSGEYSVQFLNNLSQNKMKQTVQRLTDEIKQKDSQLVQLKKTVGKLSDGSGLVGSAVMNSALLGSGLMKLSQFQSQIANQRKSRLQQVQKYKDYVQLRRANNQLTKQRNHLQSQLQAAKINQTRLQLKHRQKQTDLQRIMDKTTQQFKKRQIQLQKQIDMKSDQNLKNKMQKQQLKRNVDHLMVQLEQISALLQQRQQYILDLQAQNQALKYKVQQYQQIQQNFIAQNRQIKQQAQLNLNKFQALLQQRNDHFMKIQKLKEVEINKLKYLIEQLQTKLQGQISDGLLVKKELQNLQKYLSKYQNQLDQTKISYQIFTDNYKKSQQQSQIRLNQVQQMNQLLNKNLVQMAQNLKILELELHQTIISKQSLQKQILKLNQMKEQFNVRQKSLLQQINQYQQTIQEQIIKFSQLNLKYNEIKIKIEQVQRQNQSLFYKLNEKEDYIYKLKQQINKQFNDYHSIKSQKFDLQLKNKQFNIQIQELNKKIKQKQQKILLLETNLQTYIKESQKNKTTSKFNILNSNDQNNLDQSRSRSSRIRNTSKFLTNPGVSFINHGLKLSKRNTIDLSSCTQINQRKNSQQKAQISPSFKQAQFFSKNSFQQGSSINSSQIKNENMRISVLRSQSKISQQQIQIRNRMPTVTQRQDDIMKSYSQDIKTINRIQNVKKDMKQSQINIPYDEQISADQQSEQKIISRQIERESIKKINQSPHIDPAQSYTEKQAIAQYAAQIQNLRNIISELQEENEELIKQKIQLETNNNQLINELQNIRSQNNNKNFMNQSQQYNIQDQQNNLKTNVVSRTNNFLAADSSQFRRSFMNKSYNQIDSSNVQIVKKSVRDHSPNHSGFNSGDNQDLHEQNQVNYSKGYIGKPSLKNIVHFTNQNIEQKKSVNNFAKSTVSGRNKEKQENDDVKSLGGRSFQKISSKRIQQIQLIVTQLQQKNKQYELQLEEQQQNNEKLITQLQSLQNQLQLIHQQSQSKAYQLQQVKRFYEKHTKSLQAKIQSLVQQQIQKQSEQAKLLKNYNQIHALIDQLNQKIRKLQEQIQDKKNIIIKIQQSKDKAFRQYRKYQEQSQLQILKLKQFNERLTKQYKSKQKQIELLAQDYFELQSQFKQLQEQKKNKQIQIRKKNNKIQQLNVNVNDYIKQLHEYQLQKKSFNSKIYQFQQQLNLKDQEIVQITKSTNMIIKKYQIKINTFQQQKTLLKQKISQKDNINQSLKHQIALYNEQTQKLKDLNKQLTNQLQKTERQIKQIMKSYQNKFQILNKNFQSSQLDIQKLKQLIKSKDDEIFQMIKKIKTFQEQTIKSFDSQIQIKQSYEKYKSAKQSQINSLYSQIQLKNDQLIKLKNTHAQQILDFHNKEEQYLKKISLSEQIKKQYKEKLIKYQTVLQQLEKELTKMSLRPLREQFQQIQFQNQLFKNRIQQLQQMLRQFGPKNHSKNQSQQLLKMNRQYQKYKSYKQRQINDLRSEIQKYSIKINQIEQSNYILQKQLQKYKLQNNLLMDQNFKLSEDNQDLKQDLDQLKKQIEFYKGKRMENLTKLLNQTMG